MNSGFVTYKKIKNMLSQFQTGQIMMSLLVCIKTKLNLGGKHLNNVDDFITGCINEGLGSGVICNLVFKQFERTITEVDVCHYRDKLSISLLKAASKIPFGTPVEQLIAEFHLKKM